MLTHPTLLALSGLISAGVSTSCKHRQDRFHHRVTAHPFPHPFGLDALFALLHPVFLCWQGSILDFHMVTEGRERKDWRLPENI